VVDAGVLDLWIHEVHQAALARKLRAVMLLGYFPTSQGIEALLEAAVDPSPEVQLAVTLSLGRLKDQRGLEGLTRVLSNSARTIPDLSITAALAACAEGCPDRLIPLLQDASPRTRVVGAWALSEVADLTVLPALLVGVKDEEPEVRAKVARALARIPGEASLEALIGLAQDPIWFVRVRGLDALSRFHEPLATVAVLHTLEDEIREVRYRAAYALRQMRAMNEEEMIKLLTTRPRTGLESLISEWDRSGYLWKLVANLSTRDWSRYVQSREVLKALIAAGADKALVNFARVFPEIKIRLRLLRLLMASPNPDSQAELLALAEAPGTSPQISARIKQAFPGAGATLQIRG
jgi:HEAT repeat protein